jgi:phage baseplate assembly protein W
MATQLSRADTLGTANSKKAEYFSDFLNSFAKTPIGNQLGRVTNEQSVNQSLRNLIFTNLGERPFQPDVGSNIRNLLFDPNNGDEIFSTIENYIENVIERNEKRVILNSVSVQSGASFTSVNNFSGVNEKNAGFDENSVLIRIVYNLINNPAPITLTVILKRVR